MDDDIDGSECVVVRVECDGIILDKVDDEWTRL